MTFDHHGTRKSRSKHITNIIKYISRRKADITLETWTTKQSQRANPILISTKRRSKTTCTSLLN